MIFNRTASFQLVRRELSLAEGRLEVVLRVSQSMPSDDSSSVAAPAPAILGLGTDIVEIVRIGKMIERHGELFLNRVFTEDEIRYCQRRKECYQHFAGRWAAKEAVMKTLGTGFTRGIGWQDIEICTQKSGKPTVNIRGSAREFADKMGISDILITISHCRAYATATAIALGR